MHLRFLDSYKIVLRSRSTRATFLQGCCDGDRPLREWQVAGRDIRGLRGEGVVLLYKVSEQGKKGSNNNKRIIRKIEGKGTWSCKSDTTQLALKIQGQEYDVGSRRQFKFKYDDNYACKDYTISYIMHEYVAYQDFLEYKANQMNIHNFDFDNMEKIAFCHVYTKVEKNAKSSNKRKLELPLPSPSEKKKAARITVNNVGISSPVETETETTKIDDDDDDDYAANDDDNISWDEILSGLDDIINPDDFELLHDIRNSDSTKEDTRTDDDDDSTNKEDNGNVSPGEVLCDGGLDQIKEADFGCCLPDADHGGDIKVNGMYLEALLQLDYRDMIHVLNASAAQS